MSLFKLSLELKIHEMQNLKMPLKAQQNNGCSSLIICTFHFERYLGLAQDDFQ